jgi:hypothetical protein
MSDYSNVLLEPAVVRTGPNSDLSDVPADEQTALANAFYADIYDALKDHCSLVTTVSPGTIRLRFALVDAKIPNATVNTVATYTPYARSVYNVASFAFNKGVGYFAGTATVEGFARDEKGTLLFEVVDKRGGTTSVVSNTLDNWRDVRHIFEAWGDQLRTRLQALGVCRE